MAQGDGSGPGLTPIVAGGGLVIAARDTPNGRNVVLGLGTDGTEQWRWETSGRDRIGGHVVDGDRVFLLVANPNGAIYALDRGNGHQIWERPLAGDLQAIPVVAGDAVYVAGTEGIVAVDKATGAVRWSWPLGPVLGAGLAVTGGLVIATTRDAHGGGRVMALADPTDPRLAARPSASAAASNSPSQPPALIRVLSADPISGRTLLLSTAVAPDGTTYVADIDNSRILIRHPDGKIESWGEKGSGHGQFDFTEVTRNDQSGGVAISPDGKLIAVGDGSNHRVQLFDSSRTWLRSIGRLGREDGQFVNPCCVTIDAQDRIWVVDVAQSEVQVFDSRGVHLRTFGEQGSSEGQLDRPGSVFIDPGSDEVFVPDFANRGVSVFSDDGTWLRDYDGSSTGIGPRRGQRRRSRCGRSSVRRRRDEPDLRHRARRCPSHDDRQPAPDGGGGWVHELRDRCRRQADVC